jgi:DNA transformation protein and related proteins
MGTKKSATKGAAANRRTAASPDRPAGAASTRKRAGASARRAAAPAARGTAGTRARRPARRPHPDAGFIAYVLDQLDDPTAHARAMFGGHGLYRGERFFGIVHGGQLFLKVDDATRPEFEARGMGPFRPGPGTTMRGYFEVPPEVLEQAAEFRRWTARALRVE